MSRLYNIIIFTAALPSYADPFIDRLENIQDPSGRYYPYNNSNRGGSQGGEYRGDIIQRPRWIKKRFYRSSCISLLSDNNNNNNKTAAPRYVKDLSVIGVPLDSVVLLDNTPEVFGL
eukprot:Tbor_TRINITY_DN5906_c1_g5::TRINITY_DN5906_c1_g5_i3::g.18498::m.18498